jgi:hypothetical protein
MATKQKQKENANKENIKKTFDEIKQTSFKACNGCFLMH